MQKGKIYKGIAIVLFALIFVGAVVVGDFELLRAFTEGEFNFGVFIYIAAAGLLSCVPIYGIGDILEGKTGCGCKAEPTETAVIPQNQDTSGDWVCAKCGINNQRISTFCKNCGEYK